MEEKATLLENLIDTATDYGKTSYELVKLKAVDKITEVISSLVPLLIVILFIASCLLFLSIGLGFWLGDVTGKTYLGFLIVAGIYILLGVIIRYFLFESIKRRIGDHLIKHILK